MAISIGKLAPTAIVVAAVGYCCWPYLEEKRTHPAAQDAKKLPEIGATQLTPKIVPATARDPFGLTLPPKLVDDTKGDKDKTKAGTGSIESPAKSKSEPAEPATAPAPPALPESVAEPEPEIIKIDTSELTLNATFLRGTRRVAMINSKEYAEGDVLDQAEAHPKPPTVARIFQHRVLLERQGRTAELFYPHSTPKTEDVPKPSAVARPEVAATPVARPATKKYVNPAFANPKPKPAASPSPGAQGRNKR